MSSTSSAGNIFMFLSLIFTSSEVFVNFCVILIHDLPSLIKLLI